MKTFESPVIDVKKFDVKDGLSASGVAVEKLTETDPTQFDFVNPYA